MKRIYTILLIAAAALVSFSCDRTDDYAFGDVGEDGNGVSAFVTLSQTSFTVNEDAGSLQVPVRVVHPKGKAFKVTVSYTENTAQMGKHFTFVEPETGVLEFEATDTLKYITFGLKRIEGYVEPGNVSFDFALTAATNGVELGSSVKGSVVINDADHPLAPLIGAWTAHGYNAQSNSSYAETSYTMHLSAYDGNIHRLYCDAINQLPIQMKGYGYTFPPVYCDVSDDLKTLSFPTGQKGGDLGSSNGGVTELTSGYINSGYYTKDIDAIVFTLQEDGTYVCEDGILYVNDYVWPTYGGYFLGKENGVCTTWTKQ